MTDKLDLEELKRLYAEATPGEWSHCEKCKCAVVMSADYPVATITSGDWGDDYPTLKMEGGSLDAKVIAVMEQITYGSVSNEIALANRAFIAAAHNALPALISRLEKAETVVKALRPFGKYYRAMVAYGAFIRGKMPEDSRVLAYSQTEMGCTTDAALTVGDMHRAYDALAAYDLAFPLESGEKT